MKKILFIVIFLYSTGQSFSQSKLGNIGYGATPPSGGSNDYAFFYNTSTNLGYLWDGSAFRQLLNTTVADATYWKLGGQALGATAAIGSTDAQRVNVVTNGSTRLNFDSGGRIFTNGNVTDFSVSASDTAAFNATNVVDVGLSSAHWHFNSSYSRMYIGANIGFQFNNSNMAAIFNVADNNSTAFALNILGGTTAIQLNSTDGDEDLALGTATAGATVSLPGYTGSQNASIQIYPGGTVHRVENAFGELYVHRTDPDTITYSGGSTTVDSLADMTLGDTMNFVQVGSSLKYIGTDTAYFKVAVMASFSFSEVSTTILADIYKNQVIDTSIGFESKIGTAGDIGDATATGIIQLMPNDRVTMLFNPDSHTGDDDLIFNKFNLTLTKL